MKISEITIQELKDYMKIDNADEDNLIQAILDGSKMYIKKYTGLTEIDMDLKEDLTLVLYVLCAEMYDNRQYTIDKASVNPIIKDMLNMHSTNLL